MNLNHLAAMYDRLTPWERIPLLVAAEARGDTTEFQRLTAASPMRNWNLSEHLLDEQALYFAAIIYVGEQLDAAARYYFSLWKEEVEGAAGTEDWLLVSQANAYFFATNFQAWQQFCGELKVAPEAVTTINHHGWFLKQCESHIPANALTAEQLRVRFRDRGHEGRTVVTVEGQLASWRSILREMTYCDLPPLAGKETR